jgi:hypothetical protein
MDEEASEETAVPSFTPVAELEKTALELSTVKKVQTEKKGRQRLECALPRRGDHRRPPRHSLIWGSMALERAARSVGVFMGSL